MKKMDEKIFVNRKEKKKRKIGVKVIVLIILLALGLFTGLIGFITDFLWFKELGYVGVFFTKLFTQLKMGIPVFLILTFLSYIYFKLIKRGYYKHVIGTENVEAKRSINMLSWLLAGVVGVVVSYTVVAKTWFNWLQFSNSTDFGVKDPIFGLDISFYVFKLGFLKDLNNIFIIIIALFIILTFIYYAVLMIAKPPQSSSESERLHPFDEGDRFDGTNGEFHENSRDSGNFSDVPFGKIFKNINDMADKARDKTNIGNVSFEKVKKTVDDKGMKQIFHVASKQLITAGVLLFIMIFVHFVLIQFELLHSHTGAVYGAGYRDVKVTLWVYRILAGLSILGAFGVMAGVKKHRPKRILVVPVVMVIVGLIGTATGMAVQSFVVLPNEIAKESKYLERNIAFTQKAYGLDNVFIRPFAANLDLTSEDIKKNDPTISNIRINDYEPAETFYNQTQSIRQYYTFEDVDVDRYMLNGDYTQVFLSAREIDESKISQTWVNKHLKYTHGYGITLSRVDEVTASGQPKMLVEKIPPESDVKEIKLMRPEIYFGELTNEYAIVGSDEDEFDYPNGDSNSYTRYEGAAGIKMTPLNRLIFSIKENSIKLLVSSNISSKSRIIINRNIKERVRKIMPYLEYDRDPYMVTANNKLYWIMDAYTTSDRYPYSEPFDKSTGVNYIRNSVKVVVDAYNGNTDYYIVDKKDPIAATFKNIYPSLFKDSEEMPAELKAHMRYPNALFELQARVYSRYHMKDVKVFYQDEDLWDIANEIYGTKERPMTPNYYIMNLPGEKNAEFVNSMAFTPRDKKNMTGLLVARNDGKDYSKLVLYKLPKSKVVYGPRQIEAQIDQDTEISKEFSLWNSAGSKYSRGNMFVIPIEQSLLYVEPVYLEASESSIPEVKRVIVAYGDKIAYKKTLGEALEAMFGEGSSNEEQPEKVKTQSDLIKEAKSTYKKAVEAQKKGDWAEYGKEMKRLEKILEKLN